MSKFKTSSFEMNQNEKMIGKKQELKPGSDIKSEDFEM